MYIYILELANNKYYVGKTANVKQRFAQHCAGKGSEWTRLHKPKRVVQYIQCDDPMAEDIYTKKYMRRWGIENVRGGSYSQVALFDWQVKSLEHEFKTTRDRCFKCGMSGHFAKDCITEPLAKDCCTNAEPDIYLNSTNTKPEEPVFKGSNNELKNYIEELESIIYYVNNIKPHQYLSKSNVEILINNSNTYLPLRKILIKDLKSHFQCPKCNKNTTVKYSTVRGKHGVQCVDCECVYQVIINNSYKMTLEAYESLQEQYTVANGSLVYLPSTKKCEIYKSWVNNIDHENKYNKFIEFTNIKFNNDNEVIEHINKTLAQLWRQLAIKF